jgi:hypothetical protein
MTRLLACCFIVYSYFEIRNELPLLAAASDAHAGIALSLWIALSVQAFVCGVMLLVPVIARVMPEAVHFGWRRLSDYSPNQLQRVLPAVGAMSGMMCLATSLLLGLGIHVRIQNARSNTHNQALVLAMYAALLVSYILITWYYGQQMDEAAGEE